MLQLMNATLDFPHEVSDILLEPQSLTVRQSWPPVGMNNVGRIPFCDSCRLPLSVMTRGRMKQLP